MKKAFMVTAMVAIITIAGSMVYYYVFYLPRIEKARFELINNPCNGSVSKDYLAKLKFIKQGFVDIAYKISTENILLFSKEEQNKYWQTKVEDLKEVRREFIELGYSGCDQLEIIRKLCEEAINNETNSLEEATILRFTADQYTDAEYWKAREPSLKKSLDARSTFAEVDKRIAEFEKGFYTAK